MHSVTPRTPINYHRTDSTPPASPAPTPDTNPGNLSPVRRADCSTFVHPKSAYRMYEDFRNTGMVPKTESVRSSVASCCLKYGEPQVLAAFLDSGNVKTLDLSSSFLDVKCAKAFAEVLKTNTTLLRISLAENDFGTEGLKAICGALEENCTLVALDLSHNDTTGPEHVEAIAKLVAKNKTLEILKLECSGINAERLPILAKALEQNQTLGELGLAYNFMGPEGVCTVLKIAENKPGLKILDLRGNKIGPEGGKLIAGTVKTNSTLTQLDLGSNDLGSAGANAILNAIHGNTTLRSLSLSYNGMDGDSAKPIASLLRNNTALFCLDFSCNRKLFSGDASFNEAMELIVHGLECNTTLTRLNLTDSHSFDEPQPSRPHSAGNWCQPQNENNLSRINYLLQRNRTFDALSEKDGKLWNQLFPGHAPYRDEGRLLAGAMIVATPATASYEASMVEVQCCVNVLASRT